MSKRKCQRKRDKPHLIPNKERTLVSLQNHQGNFRLLLQLSPNMHWNHHPHLRNVGGAQTWLFLSGASATLGAKPNFFKKDKGKGIWYTFGRHNFQFIGKPLENQACHDESSKSWGSWWKRCWDSGNVLQAVTVRQKGGGVSKQVAIIW